MAQVMISSSKLMERCGEALLRCQRARESLGAVKMDPQAVHWVLDMHDQESSRLEALCGIAAAGAALASPDAAFVLLEEEDVALLNGPPS